MNISNEILSLDGKQLNETEKIPVPYFDIERFSGFTFEYQLPFQFTIKIKKSGYFNTIIDEDFYIPIFLQTELFSYSETGVILSKFHFF